MNLEDELSNILAELKKKEISLRETRDLYFEAKNKFLAAEEKTEVAGINAVSIFLRVIVISNDFVKNWQSGKINPKNEELDLLEEGCEEVPAVLDYLKENGVKIDDNFFSKTKTGFKELKQKIQQEKVRRQQQIQTLLKNQKQNPVDNSSNSQFQQIQEQLNNLQNQIQNLEKQDNSSVPTSQSDKQELSKLKNQIQQLQKNLKNKQEDKTAATANNSQQQPKQFNWLYLVIPMGAAILIMGIIIFAFWRKKSKKE